MTDGDVLWGVVGAVPGASLPISLTILTADALEARGVRTHVFAD